MKALVVTFNQEKALVGTFSILRDCEIFANLHITFVSSSSVSTGLQRYRGTGVQGCDDVGTGRGTGVQECDDVVPRLRAGPPALIVTLTPAHHYTSGTSVFTHTNTPVDIGNIIISIFFYQFID